MYPVAPVTKMQLICGYRLYASGGFAGFITEWAKLKQVIFAHLLLALIAAQQEQVPQTTIRTQVELVEVPVVVRDGHRRAVDGLTQNDFEIYDNGKKQAIAAFSVQHFAPQANGPAAASGPAAKGASKDAPKPTAPRRFVALLFDNLNMDLGALRPAQEAAEKFVRTSLAPGDRVAVVTTAESQSVDFIGDGLRLVQEIEAVKMRQRTRSDALGCPRISPYEGYLIANRLDRSILQAKVDEYRACAGNRVAHPEDYVTSRADGVWEETKFNSRATLHMIDMMIGGMATLPGERSILLTSGGYLSGNLEFEQEQIMHKALRAEVVINALDAKGLYAIPPGDVTQGPPLGRQSARGRIAETQIETTAVSAQDDSMAVLASGTGGTFFQNNNDLVKGFRELGMVPETVYLLAFSRADVPPDGRYHALKVKLTQKKGYSVHARVGYTAPAAAAK